MHDIDVVKFQTSGLRDKGKQGKGIRGMSKVRVCMAGLVGLMLHSQVLAQDTGAIETAKPADTVSPYGVSFLNGAFTYDLPLFSIGEGEWPNKLVVTLNYDSSGNRHPNAPWNVSTNGRVSGTFLRYVTGFEEEPFPDYHTYNASFVIGGGRSQSFQIPSPGAYLVDWSQSQSPNVFEPASLDGSSLSFQLNSGQPGYFDGEMGTGKFTYTDSSGNIIEVGGAIINQELIFSMSPTAILANGNNVDFAHITGNPRPFTRTSTGLLIQSETTIPTSSLKEVKVCAFNLAHIDANQITGCSQSQVVATLRYTKPASDVGFYLTSVTRPDGSIYNFDYVRVVEIQGNSQDGDLLTSAAVRYHLSCVKEPGQSSCTVQNTYDACDGPGGSPSQGFDDPDWSGSRDRVSQQTLIDGRVVTYTYTDSSAGTAIHPCRERRLQSVAMNESGSTTHVALVRVMKDGTRGVASITDPVGRTQSRAYTGANPDAYRNWRDHLVSEATSPDGQKTQYDFDARGNPTQVKKIARPGTGLADIITSAAYPASCANAKTCNKPTSVTDANGNVSTFTYSSVHGGVLTQVGPAVGGVSPAAKYSYVQRTPWLKSGSGYVASDPIWLLSEERSCISSALNLSSGTCAAGASDLVTTTYDYGPNSGPNNLWLRGVAVTADGQTQHTCYSYDQMGRRISETQPNANLTSCP